MSSDAFESAHQAVSVLLYRDILSVWERVIPWETEWRAVGRNLAEDVVSDFDCFIVATCGLPIILHCFFKTLVGVLASVK